MEQKLNTEQIAKHNVFIGRFLGYESTMIGTEEFNSDDELATAEYITDWNMFMKFWSKFQLILKPIIIPRYNRGIVNNEGLLLKNKINELICKGDKLYEAYSLTIDAAKWYTKYIKHIAK